MKQELATLRPNEYTSNNTIVKSQKVITTSNFHLKTEQQEQEHRSPQHRVQFRQTSWRKPRMPYNKFPDGFQMQQVRKSTGKKITEDDIDKMVRHYQYKEVEKYLKPIPLKVEQTIREQESDNPFATYQKYLKIKNKFSEQLQMPERERSLNKYKSLSTRVQQQMRVNDCITLEVIKRGHNTGTLKKMLHIPSLQLVSVREEPLNSKESRNAIKQWVNFWQSKLNRDSNPRFLKVHGMAFNYPQGAVSILTEYHPEGSLLDLLNTVLTLPESVIKEVFRDVTYSLKEFYDITEMQFGGLSPSQILLTNRGIQLGMGLYYHFVNTNSNSIYHIKTPQKTNIFEMNTTQRNFMKSSISQPANIQTEKALDIFKLGLIVLQCAIGTFQNFEQSAVLHETLKSVFSEEGQKQVERDGVCCLVHCESYLLEWAIREERIKKQQTESNRMVLYFKFLKDRFSIHLVSFLCECLKLSHTKRASLRDLLGHSFLHVQGKDNVTVDLCLEDLKAISGEPDPVVESIKEERTEKFIGHVLQVLSNCSREEVIGLLKNSKEKILGLAKYIGLHYYGLGEKLYEAMMALARSMRH